MFRNTCLFRCTCMQWYGTPMAGKWASLSVTSSTPWMSSLEFHWRYISNNSSSSNTTWLHKVLLRKMNLRCVCVCVGSSCSANRKQSRPSGDWEGQTGTGITRFLEIPSNLLLLYLYLLLCFSMTFCSCSLCRNPTIPVEFQNAGLMRSDLLCVLTPVKVKNVTVLDK